MNYIRPEYLNCPLRLTLVVYVSGFTTNRSKNIIVNLDVQAAIKIQSMIKLQGNRLLLSVRYSPTKNPGNIWIENEEYFYFVVLLRFQH